MRFLIAAFAALVACQAPEVHDTALNKDWSDLGTSLQGVNIALMSSGVSVPVPVLEVETPTPGETMRLRASGLTPGQGVAFFVGLENTASNCGTYVPVGLRRYFGTCLGLIGAKPVGNLAVADANGEAMIEVPVPTTVPSGRTIAFEAISPAGPLTTRSAQVPTTTVRTKLSCSFESPGVQTVQGADDVVVGEMVCTAIGGSVFVDEMLMRSRYDFGFPLYENISVWVGGQIIAIEPWNGTETHFELAYEIGEGETVRFRVEVDVAPSGSDYTDEIAFDSVDGESENGDYVRWLGAADDVAYVTIAP